MFVTSLIFIYSFISMSTGRNHYLQCMLLKGEEEDCKLFGEKSRMQNEEDGTFLSTFKNILLQRMGLSRPPNVTWIVSPSEKEYLRNVTKELEDDINFHVKGRKIEVIYPEVRKFNQATKVKNKGLVFKLPDCTAYVCTILVAKMRVVLRINRQFGKIPKEVKFYVRLVDDKNRTIRNMSSALIKTGNFTMLEQVDLDDDINKFKSYTGKAAIIVTCDRCIKGRVTLALQALRYGKQRTSLTILWTKETGISARNFGIQPCAHCCGLHVKIIRLEDLGWHRWIIAPERILFGYCYGSCEEHDAFVTDYSHLVQSIRRSPVYSKDFVGSTCCVPTKFSLFTILYVSDQKVIKKLQLETIMASQCGCV